MVLSKVRRRKLHFNGQTKLKGRTIFHATLYVTHMIITISNFHHHHHHLREQYCHYYRWFSRYVIAAMLVDGKQKIAH